MLPLFTLITSCASVDVPDQEWCADLGADGASCFHTLSDAQRDIPKAQWDTERVGMLVTQSDNFAALKAIVLKLCGKTKLCKYDDVKKQFEVVETRIHRAKHSKKGH